MENKLYFAAGDLYRKCLDYNKILETRTFYNRIFAHRCIPLITKPIRVTSKTVPLIGNIFTNFILTLHWNSKKESLKVMCLPIFLYLSSYVFHQKLIKEYQKITIHKRVMHGTNLMAFKADLRNVNWNSINCSFEINSKYETFLKIWSELNEKPFSLKDFQIKVKNLQTPWISKGLKKSSKQKKKLYIKFSKI